MNGEELLLLLQNRLIIGRIDIRVDAISRNIATLRCSVENIDGTSFAIGTVNVEVGSSLAVDGVVIISSEDDRR